MISEGLGVELPVIGLTMYVIWADNVFFIGHQPTDVQKMAQDFTDVLHGFNLHWKPASMEYVSTLSGAPSNLSIWERDST